MRRRLRRKNRTIEISSLIDILFILLIFLMVSVRFTESRSLVELSLPEASESLIGDFENEMIISIDASGNYFMEGRSLEKSELIHILKTKNGIDKQINIILEVDEAAPFGSFMMITNLLKEKSISSVNIATRIKK